MMKVVETTLGWFFRKVKTVFSSDAARESVRRATLSSEDGRGLREVLGTDYSSKYEIFLPFIDPSRIDKVDKLGEGANGLVLKGVWKGPAGELNVALKRPKQGLEEAEARKNFLHEVRDLA